MTYLYVVPTTLLENARKVWDRHHGSSKFHRRLNEERTFFDFMGVTIKQQVEFYDEWKLKVTRDTYKKFEIMASDTPHMKTLFKAIEIRHKGMTE